MDTAEAVPSPAVPSDAGAAPRRWLTSDRGSALLIALAVLVGFALRVIGSIGDHVVVSNDEATYLTTGLNFWGGHGFTTLSGAAELHFPPGLPFVLGGVHELLGGDPHTATLVVNVVTTTLVILPIAGIAALVKGRRAAVLAAWFAALCPAIAILALSAGGSAGLFTLLVVTALWLALRCTPWRPRSALFGAAGAGFLVGGAYLTRPEGLLYSLVLVPALALSALGGWRGARRAGPAAWRRAGYLVAAFTVPLVLLVAPYMAYLHRETGVWQLTTKSQTMSTHAWRALAGGDRAPSLAEQYRLDPSGHRFRTPRDVSSIMRDDPVGFFSVVGANARELAATTLEPSTTPYPNWVLLPSALLLFAGFAVWRYRHSRVVLATLAAIAVPIVTTLSYIVIDRYLIASAALMCALVAVGLLALPRRWITVAIVGTFVLLGSSAAVGLYSPTEGWFHPNVRNPEKKVVGRWIGEHSEPGDFVMGTSQVVGYYAGRDIVPVPYASPRQVVAFGRHYGVRYLVVDRGNTVRFRPQLASLLSAHPGPGLKPVFGGRAPYTGIVVLELVPRPPKFHGAIPLLDQPPKD
jgi:hypothetical protein